MARTLTLSIVVLILALMFVGIGWLLARVQSGATSVTRQDLADGNAAVVRHLDGRVEALSRQLDVRADRIERRLDILLNIATNIPPDLGRTHR